MKVSASSSLIVDSSSRERPSWWPRCSRYTAAPFGVSVSRKARRSDGSLWRVTRPSFSRRSAIIVSVPVVTPSRSDSGFIRMGPAAPSSAIAWHCRGVRRTREATLSSQAERRS